MHNRPLILFWLGLLLCNTESFCQQHHNYIFRHINETDGLLHTEVRAITQDGKGYIWILTQNGLQRYDGSRFVNYSYDPGNPGGITDTRRADLFADKNKNCIWIINHEIEKLDLEKNKFTIYTQDKIVQDSSFKFTNYTDYDSYPWLAGDFGFWGYQAISKKMIPLYLAAPFLAPNKSNFFFIDRQNEETWLADWRGLSLFQKKTKQVYTHDNNPGHHPMLKVMDKKSLTGIMKDSENNIWISSGRRYFYKYNALSEKLSVYSLADIKKSKTAGLNQDETTNVQCFFEDSHHTVWIGTQNAGLLKYNREKDSFTSIVNEDKNKQGLHYSYTISCIFQDAEENIWLGTDKGINIFNPYRQNFQSVHHEENNPESLPENEIQHFIQTAAGDILSGTWGGGITLYDSNWNFKKNISIPGQYEYNLIWSLIENDDGNIWAGCQHGYIHIYNPFTESIKTISAPELNFSTIRCMAKDKKGNVWMGLHDGKVTKWDKQQNKFYSYNDSVKGIAQTFSPVLNIFFDSRQRCWVSTESGFKQFDTEERVYSAAYLPDKNNPHSISSNTIEGIEECNDSTLAIGTMYGGLNFFNTRTKTFTHFTTIDGLPSNTIYALKKDATGYLWLTTDYGLYKTKPDEKKFTRFNIEPGIINSAFKSTGFYPLQDGRWLTSTATEIICFKPTDHQANNAAKVEVTGFRVFDNPFFIDSLLAVNQPVHLDYKQNFLTIEFALLNFSNLQQTKYYYQLTGINSDWVNAGTKQFAAYTNLEPGEYSFSVKADNGDQITEVTSFKIIITPPFWKTWWFKSLLFLLVAGLIYWLVKKRIKNIRTEAWLKQKISETEMSALRAQMNPHFIFNCLNSIDNLIQTDQKEKATDYLAKFAKLIRAILENSKNNTIPCWKDLEALQLYLQMEELRWDKKISCTVTIADEIQNGDYKVPPMVIQPFVENAIHHGLLNKITTDKKLTIDVKLEGTKIKYTIADNGVGRLKAGEYKKLNRTSGASFGVQITKERINLFNQGTNGAVKITDRYNELQQPEGTVVEVWLTTQPITT